MNLGQGTICLFMVWMLVGGSTGCTSPLKSLANTTPGLSGSTAIPNQRSGLALGSEVTAWHPWHVSGPDAGSRVCPVCTYQDQPAVLVFAKNTANTLSLANRLEMLADNHADTGLKVLLVVTDGQPDDLKQMAEANQLRLISLCLLDPKTRRDDLAAYGINEQAENTILFYRDYVVLWKSEDLRTVEFDQLQSAVNATLREPASRNAATEEHGKPVPPARSKI